MVLLNGYTVNIKQFPNGESYADISKDKINTGANLVELKYESDIDLMMLKYIVDYIRDLPNMRNVPCNLIMKYIPYSRMDRKEESRLFTLKSIASFINSMNFDCVTVWEPHSDVSVDLINNVNVIDKSAGCVTV